VKNLRTQFFYYLKPAIPRFAQLAIRRQVIVGKLDRYAKVWPIDPEAGRPPENWEGWPGRKKFALVLTHDVEKQAGQEKVRFLADMERELGFRSSFNFVPERYPVSGELRRYLTENDFEVGVHGLNHDGKYFNSREIFRERAARINRYLEEWGAVGFRMPSMHHRLDWFHDLHIEYDASTFDTDPFEPYPDGVHTIFPFIVEGESIQKGYVELPYTLPQDFLLFVILREKNIRIWKEKVDWIVERGGMALFLVHPDYMNFEGMSLRSDEFPAEYYREILLYIKSRYDGEYWHALPKDVAAHVRNSAPVNCRRTWQESI